MYSIISVMTINNKFSVFIVFLWMAAIILHFGEPMSWILMHGVYMALAWLNRP